MLYQLALYVLGGRFLCALATRFALAFLFPIRQRGKHVLHSSAAVLLKYQLPPLLVLAECKGICRDGRPP